MLLGLVSGQAVRFGHFDYLKEDSDDEFKRENPADLLKPTQLIRSVTLADKLAAKDKLLDRKHQESYQKKNAPPVCQLQNACVHLMGCVARSLLNASGQVG